MDLAGGPGPGARACPSWRVAEILEVEGAAEVRERLRRFVNAPHRVSLHDDEASVGQPGVVQLTVVPQPMARR